MVPVWISISRIYKALICNKGICLQATFLLVRNLQQQAILITPFLNQILPLHKVDQTGTFCTIQRRDVHYHSISDTGTRFK